MKSFVSNLHGFLLVLLLVFPSVTLAKQPLRIMEGQVTKVSDGDTVSVIDPSGAKLKIRLYGVDAPETEKSNKKTGRVSKPGQPYGEAASRALWAKLYGQKVKLEVMAVDRYRRLVCLVWLGDRNINREIVAEGFGWAYRDYLDTPYESDFIASEAEARFRRKGLWRESNPRPPWEFRKSLRADSGLRKAPARQIASTVH